MFSKLTASEVVAAGLLFLASTALLATFSLKTTYSKHLDSVFLFEALRSIQASGVPDSITVNGAPAIVTLFNATPPAYCASPLTQPEEPYHIIDNHAYLVLYLLALPAYFVSPEAVFAAVNALAHLVLLFVPYLFLRATGVSVAKSLLFVACVGVYAAWSWSFTGDYYMDRVYMLFLTPVLFGVHMLAAAGSSSSPQPGLVEAPDSTARAPAIAIIGGFALLIAAALCTERGAVMAIGLLSFYLLFYRRELRNKRVLPLMAVTLALLLAYLIVYFHAFYKSVAYAEGLAANRLDTFARFWGHLASPGGAMLLLVNLLPLGIFTLFSGYRYLLLAAGALMPNLLLTIGGAELNGWSTHYHVMYIPFVVFTACIGYSRIGRWSMDDGAAPAGDSPPVRRVPRLVRWLVPVLTLACLFIVARHLDPVTGFDRNSSFAAVKNGIFGRVWNYYFDPNASTEKILTDHFSAVAAAIPPGSTVSATEAAMPSLYAAHRVYYFPLGLDKADYLVIDGTATQEKLSAVNSFVTIRDEKDAAAIRRCVLERIQALGFNVVQAFGPTLVLKRRPLAG